MDDMTLLGIKAAVAAGVAALTAVWGWFGWLVVAWVLLMLADWLIGSAAAAKDGRWSSAKMREGAWHKGGMILVVCIALVADWLIATVIANICTDAYFVWFTLRHSSNLSIDPRTVIDRARRRLAVTAREVGSILAIGIPSAITNLTQSVGIVMINLFLLPYGTDAVAAMGIALKVIMIAVLVFVGFAFGAQPLIGYNYGARNMPRLRGILRFSYLFLSLFALVMTVVLSLSDRLLMGFFIEDATIITLGAGMLRVQLLSLVCVAVVMVTTCTFQSAGKAVGAFVLSISRQGVMLAITLFVGSRLAGYQGVIAAQAIADLLTAIVAVILFVVMLPELRSRKAR